jgi:hypothetical protein
MPTDIAFFCYSRNDSHFALRLAKDLRKAGVKVWMDQLDIKPGSHWDASIETGLNTANCLIIVLTPDSVSSNNVMDEVSYALESGKRVIPVLLKECNTPFRLRRLQRIDFTKDYNDGFGQLLETLDYSPGNMPGQHPPADENIPEEKTASRSIQEATIKNDDVEKKEAVKEVKQNANPNILHNMTMAEVAAAAMTAKGSLSENRTEPYVRVSDKTAATVRFHKQRRILLIIAVIAFACSFLPWLVDDYAYSFTSWTVYRFNGIGLMFLLVKSGALVLPFLGQKDAPLKGGLRIIGLILFTAMLCLTAYSITSFVTSYSSLKPGIGVWLLIITALGGLAVLTGIVKIGLSPGKGQTSLK